MKSPKKPRCVGEQRYLIFLFGDLVLQLKLLSLQLVHPLPQLFGFLSVRCTNPTICFCFGCIKCFFSSPQPAALHLLESVLVQVVNIQGFTSLVQDLLLLLSLRLSFATALFGLQASRRRQDVRCGYLHKNAAQCAHQLLHVPSKMEARQGFLFLGIIFRSPFSFLLFLTSSLILILGRLRAAFFMHILL